MEEVGLDEFVEDLWDSRWALPILSEAGSGVSAWIWLKAMGQPVAIADSSLIRM